MLYPEWRSGDPDDCDIYVNPDGTVGQDYHDGCAMLLDLDDAVVMLSTGLKDKMGKEIFEGDVVDWTPIEPPEGGKRVVEFKDGYLGIKGLGYHNIRFIDGQRCRVLGDVYQNPELLP